MNTPLISIVIPVYNTEKYLKRCIDSVLGQSYTNFELILVDDGSKDSSGKICDDYAQQDTRVRVIHQENQGVSAARNKGIDEAKGEYISFIDSDDWVEKEYLQTFFNSKQGPKSNILLTQSVLQIDSHQQKVYYCDFASLTFSVAKLYDRTLLIKHKILFPESVQTGEDTLFMINYLNHIEDVRYLEESYYHYETNQSGACERHKGNIKVVIIGLTRLLTLLQNNCFSNELARKYANYRAGVSYYHFINELYTFSHTRKERLQALETVFSVGNVATQLYPIRYKLDKLARFCISKKHYYCGDLLNRFFEFCRCK